MPTLENVDVEFEIWCSVCGAGLCGTVDVIGTDVYIPPCESCLNEARLIAQEELREELEE